MAKEADGAYISVRFGNVLGSRGSVLHTFTSQIASGGPVTVVHPEVTRYFMTVEEAVQLVIQAGAIGTDGEVMILDMGTPVKILDVAQQLIELSGKNIEIVFTGLREGEKLHEQLFSGAESDERSKHPLVSHAEVSPLSLDVVRAYDLWSTHLGMLQTFEDWVHLPDPMAMSVGHGGGEAGSRE
jgi:FlaA1/EpsC-like NDP-sugar epimerase